MLHSCALDLRLNADTLEHVCVYSDLWDPPLSQVELLREYLEMDLSVPT